MKSIEDEKANTRLLSFWLHIIYEKEISKIHNKKFILRASLHLVCPGSRVGALIRCPFSTGLCSQEKELGWVRDLSVCPGSGISLGSLFTLLDV